MTALARDLVRRRFGPAGPVDLPQRRKAADLLARRGFPADSIRAAAGPVLRDLVLFDRYQGPGVESGCKSLAIGLILQDNTRTLTDQDADALVERVVAGTGRDHGARIRG